MPPARRLYSWWVAYGDRRGWLASSFKSRYLPLLKGTGSELIERVAEGLAERISPEARAAIAALRAKGHRLIVVSCGTSDLSERILRASGLRECFEAVLGNRFVFTRGAIAGMDMDIPTAKAKLEAIRSAGLARESTVAVGDGPTDIPLLRWAGIPVVIAPKGPRAARWAPKSCSIIASLSQLPDILERHGG